MWLLKEAAATAVACAHTVAIPRTLSAASSCSDLIPLTLVSVPVLIHGSAREGGMDSNRTEFK